MSEPLSPKDEAFVGAYLKTGNAAEAAREAGYSPRQARRLLTAHQAEIDRRRAEAAPVIPDALTVTTERLIAEAEVARQAAEANGNAAAMVAAVQLKARLAGLLNAEAPVDDPEAAAVSVGSSRDVARAILGILREAHLEPEEGERVEIGFAREGETLVRVPSDLADVVGGQPAYDVSEAFAPEAAAEAAPEPVSTANDGYRIGDNQIFDNLATIRLVEHDGRRVWRVDQPDDGVPHTPRFVVDRAEAAAMAESFSSPRPSRRARAELGYAHVKQDARVR